MEAITLPYPATENEEALRERIVGEKGKLAHSILIELPEEHKAAESVWILNDEEQVERALDPKKRNEVLQLHGVPVSTKLTTLKEYILAVFQTRALAIYRSTSQGAWLVGERKKKKGTFQRVPLTDSTKEVRRVQTLAIRSVYALGLDYAMVRLGIGAGRKTVVMSVNPVPTVKGGLEQAFVREVGQYTKECTQPKPELDNIVLGADPEFVMMSPNKELVIASQYFPLKGRVGCDAAWLGQNRSHKPVVELRPEATTDPRTLAVRIYQALIFAARKTAQVQAKWVAGAMPYKGLPLGGHIHFSGIPLNFKMLRALDNYLALPLVLAEDERGKGRRPRYGFLGDFRYQPHGGFEYRTPPSWILTPTLTKGVLSAAKVIVANYRVLKQQPLSDLGIQKAYYDGNKEVLRPWLEPLWEELRQLEDYAVYRKYLDEFHRYLASGVSWDETVDFRKVWRIHPYLHKRGTGKNG
jgi:hypothetical protein